MAVKSPDSTQNNTTLTGGPTSNYIPDLAQSRYNFRYLVFPNDLGNSDLGHYMVININVPTQLGSREVAGRYRDQSTPLGANERSKVDILRYGPGGPGNEFIQFGGGDGSRPFVSIPRATRRIAESIALHMPTPLIFNTQNVYEEISLTALGGKLGVATAGFITAAAKAFGASVGKGLATGAAKLAQAGGPIAGLAAQLAQSPINPMVEILFSNTTVRSFTFEVLMAPRNEKESINMKEIIKTIRFHGSPEYGTGIAGYGAGLTWIPPAEFDITFFNKGVENMNILRINTCVLERVEVDYSPTGVYSTFRNGHPVAARLSMGFRELEPIHKQRVLQGF